MKKDVTLIKGKHLCKSVIGYDLNLLYLHCLAQKMPVGACSVHEESTGYQCETRYSREAIQWLEYLTKSKGVDTRHAENGGELLIGPYHVDEFCEATNTIYEYHGCYWNKHFWLWCWNLEESFGEGSRSSCTGYIVITITSCRWKKSSEAKDWDTKSCRLNQHKDPHLIAQTTSFWFLANTVCRSGVLYEHDYHGQKRLFHKNGCGELFNVKWKLGKKVFSFTSANESLWNVFRGRLLSLNLTWVSCPVCPVCRVHVSYFKLRGSMWKKSKYSYSRRQNRKI